jgi:hypothetical protein
MTQLVCFRSNVGVWHIPMANVSHIYSENNLIHIKLNDGKENICENIELI